MVVDAPGRQRVEGDEGLEAGDAGARHEQPQAARERGAPEPSAIGVDLTRGATAGRGRRGRPKQSGRTASSPLTTAPSKPMIRSTVHAWFGREVALDRDEPDRDAPVVHPRGRAGRLRENPLRQPGPRSGATPDRPAAQLVRAPDDQRERREQRELGDTQTAGPEQRLQRREVMTAAANTSSKAMPHSSSRFENGPIERSDARLVRAANAVPTVTGHAVECLVGRARRHPRPPRSVGGSGATAIRDLPGCARAATAPRSGP